jgi:hypothetical protein
MDVQSSAETKAAHAWMLLKETACALPKRVQIEPGTHNRVRHGRSQVLAVHQLDPASKNMLRAFSSNCVADRNTILIKPAALSYPMIEKLQPRIVNPRPDLQGIPVSL